MIRGQLREEGWGVDPQVRVRGGRPEATVVAVVAVAAAAGALAVRLVQPTGEMGRDGGRWGEMGREQPSLVQPTGSLREGSEQGLAGGERSAVEVSSRQKALTPWSK